MKNIFIGIDHGGTNTTSLVLDINKGILSSASIKMPKKTPKTEWVEHNPDDFLNTSILSAKKALEKVNLKWSDVNSIAIANQGETSMAWSIDSKKILGPAISWEDRRTIKICEELKEKNIDKLIRKKTGILLDPYFSSSKFKWLLDNNENVINSYKNKTLRFGGTDTYVIDKLTNGEIFATDPGTASRTCLQNIFTGKWDNELIESFGLEENLLPKIIKTSDEYGKINHSEINSKSIKINGDIVDSHAALLAHGCLDSSKVKATYGTGAFIEINTGKKMIKPDGKLPIFIAWEFDRGIEYTIEGGVFSVGSAIDWFIKNNFIDNINNISQISEKNIELDKFFMIPSFTGLSAPHWISKAKASFFGLSLNNNKEDFARALLDGIAFQCSEIINLLKDKNKSEIKEVFADGGPSNNKYLMQMHADLLGKTISVSKEKNMTAYGAALVAALGSKQIFLDDIKNLKVKYDIYEPKISEDHRISLWNEWKKNIEYMKKIYKV